MGKRGAAPILIQQKLLLNGDQPEPSACQLLIDFQRRGHHVVLLARRPQRWRPTRSTVNDELDVQRRLHEVIRRGGADLDGVLYLEYGLFSWRQTRYEALKSLAERYQRSAADLWLISRSHRELETVILAGGRALAVGRDQPPEGASGHRDLRQALASIEAD